MDVSAAKSLTRFNAGVALDRALSAAGVTADALYRCTYAEEDLFYSYRRATHRSEADYGRHVSAIVLERI